jgi:LytS/YehU family sensor histidine kinase
MGIDELCSLFQVFGIIGAYFGQRFDVASRNSLIHRRVVLCVDSGLATG